MSAAGIETVNRIASAEGWSLLANGVVRSSAILGLAMLAGWLWRRASAAQHHLVLSAGCIAAVTVPLLYLLVPTWRIAILPHEEPVAASVVAADMFTLDIAPAADAVPPILLGTPQLPATVEHPWIATGLLVWILGICAVLLALWRSHRYVRSLIHSSVPAIHPRILGMASRVHSALEVTAGVAIMHASLPIPIAYGFRHPTILLPHDATNWSDERLYDVLMHEMAHIARADCVTQALASVMCALYWFNPLAWYVARELREQRERACDDLVLATGRTPSRYAGNLLDFARTLQASPTLALTALTFARSRHIQQRLHAIIAAGRSRTPVMRRGYVWGSMGAVVLAVPLAAFAPVAASVPSIPVPQVPPNAITHSPSELTPKERAMTTTSTAVLIASALSSAMPASSTTHTPPAPTRQLTLDAPRITQLADSVAGDSAISYPDLLEMLVLVNNKEIPLSAFRALSPRTIESVNIITGSEATRRYGARAGKGVVLITLKDFNQLQREGLRDVTDLLELKRSPVRVPGTPTPSTATEHISLSTKEQPGIIVTGAIVGRDGSDGKFGVLRGTGASRISASDRNILQTAQHRQGRQAGMINDTAVFLFEDGTERYAYQRKDVDVFTALDLSRSSGAFDPAFLTQRAGGSVRLWFIVDTAGRVVLSSVRVLSSPRQTLTETALELLPSLTFLPARRNGKPVAQLTSYTFTFPSRQTS